MNEPTNSAPVSPAASAPRLLSLDALRGFDMFWIVGAEEIVHALHKASSGSVTQFLAGQLSHKEWQGVAFYDLIFPLFVFIVGVSLVFSLSRSVEQAGRAATCWKIARRAVLLYLLGLLVYGGINKGVEHIRLLGVLQRIALCYLFAGLAFATLRLRGLIVMCVALLLGYWAMMTFIPVPDVGAANFAEGKNLANYIDKMYLPFRKWDGDHDPEGLLSTLPAIANCLLGVFAGLWLRRKDVPEQKKVLALAAAGVGGVVLGFLWGQQFPVIKKIWTSSYVLVAGGYACLFLAAFYQIIEVWQRRTWAMPFVWIGTNPITIYLAFNFVDFHGLAERFVGGPIKAAFGSAGELVVATVVVVFSFLLVRFLYQRRVFLRL